MLDQKGFDLWADGYDRSVGVTEEANEYPFAGYKALMNAIYNRVLTGGAKTVLDIGFGTGVLSAKLAEHGCEIWGQDFSERMLELARAKLPEARLYQGDFSKGLVPALKRNRYDAIVATYSLHHLTDEQKADFIGELLPLLSDEGRLYIGDVAFETRAQMERCQAQAGDEWDDEELYFVAEEWAKRFPGMRFERFSFCAGLLTLERA